MVLPTADEASGEPPCDDRRDPPSWWKRWVLLPEENVEWSPLLRVRKSQRRVPENRERPERGQAKQIARHVNLDVSPHRRRKRFKRGGRRLKVSQTNVVQGGRG